MRTKMMTGLSPSFRRNYKKFLKGEISILELRKNIEVPKDLIFFWEECNHHRKIRIDGVISNVVDVFIDNVLSEVEKAQDDKEKKSAILDVLLVFLGHYSCFATKSIKMKCRDLMFHFKPYIGNIRKNMNLNELTSLIASNLVEDKVSAMQRIVFKLVCLYACLAISDMDGAAKSTNLAEELSSNWRNGSTGAVTMICLQRRNHKVKNEFDLLEKYSFWMKKRSCGMHSSIF